MAEFTFGQVEATLAAINSIADHKRVAFTGRLKFLQKNGLPARDRPGRGRAGTFNFSQLMQTAVGVELLKFGMTPQCAAEIVTRNWDMIHYSIYTATYTDAEAAEFAETNKTDPTNTRWMWMVGNDALAELTTRGVSEFDTYEAIDVIELDGISTMLESLSDIDEGGRRALLINGTALTRAVINQAAFVFRFSTVEDMRADLLAEFSERQAMLEQFVHSLEAGPAGTSEETFRRVALLKGTAFAEAARDKIETDYSTSPPTPAAKVRKLATEALARLTPESVDLLLGLDNSGTGQVIITATTRAALFEMVNMGLLTADKDPREIATSEGPGLWLTALGQAVAIIAHSKVEADDVSPQA